MRETGLPEPTVPLPLRTPSADALVSGAPSSPLPSGLFRLHNPPGSDASEHDGIGIIAILFPWDAIFLEDKFAMDSISI